MDGMSFPDFILFVGVESMQNRLAADGPFPRWTWHISSQKEASICPPAPLILSSRGLVWATRAVALISLSSTEYAKAWRTPKSMRVVVELMGLLSLYTPLKTQARYL